MPAGRNRLEQLFFPAVSDSWLAVLRVGLGVQIVIFCLSLRGDWNGLLALNGGGLVQRDLTEAILTADSPLIPRFGWLTNLAYALGITEPTAITVVWICLLVTGACLMAGFLCRPSAILSWFLYLCVAKSGSLMTYGVDRMTTI